MIINLKHLSITMQPFNNKNQDKTLDLIRYKW